MKLSEAIRIGCIATDGLQEELFEGWSGGIPARACALGAAYIGRFGRVSEKKEPIEVLCRAFPELRKVRVEDYPREIGKLTINTLEQIIMRLNDETEWSREDIADWLERRGL